MKAVLFALLQYMTPQHALSRLAGKLAATHFGPVKNTFIGWFVRRYQVNMSEAAEENPEAYACFNDFFTRALKPDARPITQAPNTIACPADGSVNQLGRIEGDRILQAKGRDYTLLELLGGDAALAAEFDGGDFATIYLSPRDYHRVHMPFSGELRHMTVIPGDLFSVNDATARTVPRLFARNERVVTVFDTEMGPMAVVLVGAMIVAGIETVWAGEVAPFKRRVTTTRYQNTAVTLAKGEEMGRFKLGSTAIVLFSKDKVRWSEKLGAGSPTRMGETMGQKR